MTDLAERETSAVAAAAEIKQHSADQSALSQVPTFEGRTVPDLRTTVPGPKARAHVEFDHRYTSPSLPRAYPIVPVRGRGAAIEDIDGNLFLDFTAGIAVSSTGYAHPRVTAAVERQANDLLHFSASDFYLPIYAAARRQVRRASRRCKDRTRAVHRQLRARRRSRPSIKLARFATRRPVPGRVPGRVPRPHATAR